MNQASTLAGSPTSCSIASSQRRAVEHAVEQVDVALFLGEEMVELEAGP